ncbi:MAG: PIN domain-containing protein [Methanobrevibacter sp.]|jgi:predicted nucleic acid-binding protein|nr:PIN domain-containing protein [Methanobrevibacter sp.]
MILLDANYLISLFVKREKNHERAIEIAKYIQNEEKIISKLIIAETITILKKKLKTKDIIKIYNTLENFTIAEDSHLFNEGFEEFIKYDGEISFFDAVYIALMKNLKIREIVSFDTDFDNKKGIHRIH